MQTMKTLKTLPELSNSDILEKAPSVGALMPYAEVSGKYQFLPTLALVDIMRGQGWYPVRVEEQNPRKEERKGFQKHLVRFQHKDLIMGEEAIQAVLVNSHDRSCAYQFFTGVFRLVCQNGLIAGDTFERISVRHVGFDPEEVVKASFEVLGNAPQVAGLIDDYKTIDLTPDERDVYARAAMDLLHPVPPEEFPYRPEALLKPRRTADIKTNLWTTFNVIQENIMRGGIKAQTKTGKTRRTRAVKSIDKNLALNRALFTLTEEMAKLKKTA